MKEIERDEEAKDGGVMKQSEIKNNNNNNNNSAQRLLIETECFIQFSRSMENEHANKLRQCKLAAQF